MTKSTKTKFKPITLALIFSALIIVLGIIMIVPKYLAQKAQPLTVAQITTSGTVNLFFDPAQVTTNLNSTVDLTLKISTEGTSKASGVTVDLNYDSTALQVVSVTKGSFFSESLDDAKFGAGKITFTYVAPPSSGGKSGTGDVAIIKVKPLKVWNAVITFNSPTMATVIGVQGNSLKSNTSVGISTRGRSDIYPVTPDGTVNLLDYNELVAKFNQTGTTGFTPADIEPNGKVDLLDYNTLATDFGKTY